MLFQDDDDSPKAEAQNDILDAVGLGPKQLTQLTIKSAVQNAQQAAANSVTVQKLQQQQQSVQDAMVQNVMAGGDPRTGKTPLEIQAQAFAQQKAESDTRNFASHVGANPDDSSYILSDLADELRGAQRESIQATQEVMDKQKIKFLDDPIGWLSAQITMGDSINAADQANIKATKIQTFIRQVQEDTQQAAATNNAIAKTQTDASIQSQLDAAQARINIATSQQRLQNIGTNIAGIMNLQQINSQQLAALHTATGVQMQEEQFAMQKEHFDIQRKILGLQMQEFQYKVEENAATRQMEEQIAQTVSIGLSGMGYKQDALQPPRKIFNLFKMGDPRYKAALEYGMNIMAAPKDAQGNPYPALADNAGKLAQDIAHMGLPLQAQDASVRKMFLQQYGTAMSGTGMREMEAAGIDPKKPEQVAGYVNTKIQQEAKAMMSNVEKGGQDNIYSAPSIRTLLSTYPQAGATITESNWGRQVLAPMLAVGGDSEISSQRIAKLTAQAIKDGKLKRTPADLEGMANFYQLAASGNNVTRAYPGKGLPRQVGYKVQLETGFFGGMESYDLTNPKDINRALDLMSVKEVQGTITPAQVIMNR